MKLIMDELHFFGTLKSKDPKEMLETMTCNLEMHEKIILGKSKNCFKKDIAINNFDEKAHMS